MHQSAEETQLHGILSNEQLAQDTFTSLTLCKRKALGDVHPFPFVLESVSLQNKGSPDSCRFFVGESFHGHLWHLLRLESTKKHKGLESCRL